MGVLELLPVIGTAVQKLLDLIPDPGARAKAAEEYQRAVLDIAAKAESEQREINRTEAGSASLFVAGWRPAIGWVCGSACAWNWIGLPVMKAGLLMLGYGALDLKPADLAEMMPVLMGMLGLGGLRTVEKLNGKA